MTKPILLSVICLSLIACKTKTAADVDYYEKPGSQIKTFYAENPPNPQDMQPSLRHPFIPSTIPTNPS